MKAILVSLVLLLTISIAAANDANENDCKAYLKKAHSTLKADYLAFDQNMPKLEGWRFLADKQCYKEAATLIHLYLNKHRRFPAWQKANLFFHAGQMYAFANENDLAIKDFKRALWKVPSGTLIRWNEYVKATIAFLQKDKEKLLKYREQVAQEQNSTNLVNLEIIDSMIKNFNTPYANVYMLGEKEEENKSSASNN